MWRNDGRSREWCHRLARLTKSCRGPGWTQETNQAETQVIRPRGGWRWLDYIDAMDMYPSVQGHRKRAGGSLGSWLVQK